MGPLGAAPGRMFPPTQSTWSISTPCMLMNSTLVPSLCPMCRSFVHRGLPTIRLPVSIDNDVISCVVATHRFS